MIGVLTASIRVKWNQKLLTSREKRKTKINYPSEQNENKPKQEILRVVCAIRWRNRSLVEKMEANDNQGIMSYQGTYLLNASTIVIISILGYRVDWK